MKGCLILANGYLPSKRDILFLRKNNYNYLICADGGANSAKKLNLIPDVIIGDLDSIFPAVHDYFVKKNVQIKKVPGQYDTDVEKCIKHAILNKFTNIILLGATGNRLDHTFCNLGITLKFHQRIDIKILHEKSLLKVIMGKNKFSVCPGEIISLYGMNEKTKFTTKGLKYSLKNESLAFGKRESTSNVAVNESVEIHVSKGKAFLIRDFGVIKKNGFVF